MNKLRGKKSKGGKIQKQNVFLTLFILKRVPIFYIGITFISLKANHVKEKLKVTFKYTIQYRSQKYIIVKV